jgi:hypothetical protein
MTWGEVRQHVRESLALKIVAGHRDKERHE